MAWTWEHRDERARCYQCKRLFHVGFTNGGHFYCRFCWHLTWRKMCEAMERIGKSA